VKKYYSGEWWHFMFGDREWAYYTNFNKAFYGRYDLVKQKSLEEKI